MTGALSQQWSSENASYRYLYAGRWNWKSFNGILDDLRIYKRALSAADIGVLCSLRAAATVAGETMGSDADDAEEDEQGGVTLDGTVLHLVSARMPPPTLRRRGGSPPCISRRGATVLGATVQFTAAGEASSRAAILTQGNLRNYGDGSDAGYGDGV